MILSLTTLMLQAVTAQTVEQIWETAYPWHPTVGPNGTSWCDMTKNMPGEWPVNEDCFNAGTCVKHEDDQPDEFTGGVCLCADKDSPGNFMYNADWDFADRYFGDQCSEYLLHKFATVTYVLRVPNWKPSNAPTMQGVAGQIECERGSSGSGVNHNMFSGNQIGLATPDMTPYMQALINYPEYWGETDKLHAGGYTNYAGTIWPWQRNSVDRQHCKICSDANPCVFGSDSFGDITETGGGHLQLSFATNFNTYYNHACEKSEDEGVPYFMPQDNVAAESNPTCYENLDGGADAQEQWRWSIGGNIDAEGFAHHHKSHYLELAQEPTAMPVFNCSEAPLMSTPCVMTEELFGLNWDTDIQIIKLDVQEQSQTGLESEALDIVERKSCFDEGYTHQTTDLEFAGISQDKDRGCRWGLETSWPGGDQADMCESPYVVCLPQENTSGDHAGFPINNGTEYLYYWANDALYTIDQCKKECAFDQRCNGFEFLATGESSGTKQGSCKLIDDLPVVLTDSVGGVSANPTITTEAELDDAGWSSINGAICYEKNAPCNPYFGASDLNDVMLNCYCPNNRKGFYTKNVVRTVETTKFCVETETAVTERIKEAQANRMFHLCENWCLFNTQNPRTESWYFDPWQGCWREQYAGVGTHRSYCYRVIRDPFTIEQYFIDQRAANMCPMSDVSLGFSSSVNTPAPVMGPVTTTQWVLADSEDSCDDACGELSLTCNYADTASVLNGSSNPGQYFSLAGYECGGQFEEANEISPNSSDGWALPAVGPEGQCILRHPNANTADLMAGCNVAIGFNYRRLCACGTPQ